MASLNLVLGGSSQQKLQGPITVFGGDETILKQLEEQKKMNLILKSSLLQTKKTERARVNLAQRMPKRQQQEGPRARGRKTPEKGPRRKPRKLLTTLVTRRRRKRG